MAVVRAVPVDEGTGKMLASLLPSTAATTTQLATKADVSTVAGKLDKPATPAELSVVTLADDGTPGTAGAVELAADTTKLVLGQPASGPSLAVPSTVNITLPNAVGTNITVYTEDGTPVTFVVIGGMVGNGGTVDPPGAPTSLAGTPGLSSMALTWTAPADPGGSAITTYVVQYRLTTDSTWSTFTHADSTTASITVTGLTGGSSYDFRVAAIGDGTGPWSGTVTATPLAAGADYDEDFEGAGDLASRGFTVEGSSQIPVITAGNAVGTGASGSTNPRHVYRTFAADGHWTWYVPSGKVLFPFVRFDTDDATFVQEYSFQGNLLRKVTFPGTDITYSNNDAPYPTSGDFTIECVASGGTMTWYVDGVQAVQITGAAYTTNTKAGMDLRSTEHACSRLTYSAS